MSLFGDIKEEAQKELKDNDSSVVDFSRENYVAEVRRGAWKDDGDPKLFKDED